MSPYRSRSKCAPVVEAVERRVMLTTYYVSPTGSDAGPGTSPETAWQTVEKINALDLNAGDQVLFQGGQTFMVPAGVRTNFVGNPGFETGTFGAWNEDFNSANKTSITSVAAEVHSGTKALKLEGSGGRGQDITAVLQPYRTYELKFWAKYTAGNGNQAFVGATLSTPGGNQTSYVQVPATDVYTEYSIGLTAPGGFFYADVWTTNSQGTSNLFLDDVSVRESQVLRFDSTDSGTAGSPVVIGSYGTGRATLNAGTGSGVIAENIANFEVRDLNLTGTWNGLAATGTNGGTGVHLLNTQPGGTKLNHVYVENVDANGFKWTGVHAQGVQQKSGFNDLRIRNVSAHDNGDAGINVSGFFDPFSAAYAHTNVTIDNSFAYNNGGIPDKGSHSGHGIVVSDVNGATIERNIAHDNGVLNNALAGGPVGIWAWDSNAVTIQFNESYANKTGAAAYDGGGFDLDGGVTNSLMQYNYAHDNMGPGFLLYQFSGARAYGNNTVRYNISQNDARQGDYAAIYLGGGAGVANNKVYQNTVYVSPSASAPLLSAVKFFGLGVGNKILNNIFYVTGGVPLIRSDANYSTASIHFQGNNYHAASGAFQIMWGGTTYATLAAWRTAASQETSGLSNTGSSGDPNLLSPGGGGTIGDAARLHTLVAYQRTVSSDFNHVPVDLAALGIDHSTRDYFGTSLLSGSRIGAFYWRHNLSASNGNDVITAKAGPNGTVELFLNTPTSGAPTLAWSPAVYSHYFVSGNDGDDIFNYEAPPASVTFSGDGAATKNVFNLNAGTFNFNSDTYFNGQPTALNVAAGAIAVFAQSRSFDGLTLAGSASVTGGPLTTTSLDITGTGVLNLGNTPLIINYSGVSPIGSSSGATYDGITGLIASGRNGGTWNGVGGIRTDQPDALSGLTSLALAEASDVLGVSAGQTTVWNGVTVDDTTVLVKYTYTGDANLDGIISGDDYSAIDFAIAVPGASAWHNGDFNYDGLISGDDYSAIDFNIIAQGAPL